MSSEIVSCYLKSNFRECLLTRRKEATAARVHIEQATIVLGNADDDKKIIDFLKRLGDVKVELQRDHASMLKFKPGTFDNWIDRNEFRKMCEKLEKVDTVLRCINMSESEDDIHILVNPVNIFFEVRDGPTFPQVNVEFTFDCINHFPECRRHVLDIEQPINLLTLQPFTERRRKDLIVVAEGDEDGVEILIMKARNDRWMTKGELLDYVKRESAGKEFSFFNYFFYHFDSLKNLSVSNIGYSEIFYSYDKIYLLDVPPCDSFNLKKMKFDDNPTEESSIPRRIP